MATRDPARPFSLLAAYDSGDRLHPSDAGFAKIAEAIPLEICH
jgi:lysophospholipase L1-like esterase